jgi:histidinol-phosphatase
VAVQTDLDLALALAQAADEISLARFRALDLVVETKPDRTEVTDADRSVELKLRALIAEARPTDSVIGEEFENQQSQASPKREWIIDPIDGTANYLRGVPIWATLIALRVDGELVLGVVSAPALGRRWWAAAGSGAFTLDIDGSVRGLRVSRVSALEHASVSYNNLQLWDSAGYLEPLIALSRRVWRTRAFGDFFSYMLLAEGSVDIVAEHDLKIYDIAALVPIVLEAGGSFSDLNGSLTEASSSVLATNGALREAAQSALSRR